MFPWNLLVAYSLTIAALAPQSGQAVAAKSVMSFDIAGVGLGMSYAQVKAALAGAYRCQDFGYEPTFAEDLASEIKRRHGETVVWGPSSGRSALECTGPAAETLKISFSQDENGAVVKEISFFVEARVVAKAAFLKQIAAKFGKPSLGSPQDGSWCDPGYRCGGIFALIEGPVFSVNATGDTMRIMASRGLRGDRARKAALEAAANRVAPKRTKATF